MFKMLSRWYRYFTNTSPVPFQIWDLDGVGSVEIVTIVNPVPFVLIVTYRLPGKPETRTCYQGSFCSNAVLKVNRLTGPF